MIWKNILRRMIAVGYLTTRVRSAHLSTREKSSYYRAILIILCSIVEGLVYALVKKHTSPPNHEFEKLSEYTEVCNIPAVTLGTRHNVHLYRKVKTLRGIDDDGASFARYNFFLRDKKIINKRQYLTLNSIRKERNRLHIQGLSAPDINYTDVKVKRMAKAIKFLVTKI